MNQSLNTQSGNSEAASIHAPFLVLASASPRRLALLAQIGVIPDHVLAPEIDETPKKSETPRLYVARMAREKVEAARVLLADNSARADCVILAADTLVAVGSRLMPKAETIEMARCCLRLLSGRAHRVYTSLAVLRPDGRILTRLVESRLHFKRLSAIEIAGYLASGEWHGKAGGYAIQGLAGCFVTKMSGSYSAIVGLPLYETASLLSAAGIEVAKGWNSGFENGHDGS
jgi:septum formation protein